MKIVCNLALFHRSFDFIHKRSTNCYDPKPDPDRTINPG